MCWWCCMRVLEKCLPRNDIVRELAPYLQHVHRDDSTDPREDDRVSRPHNGDVPATPVECEFFSYEVPDAQQQSKLQSSTSSSGMKTPLSDRSTTNGGSIPSIADPSALEHFAFSHKDSIHSATSSFHSSFHSRRKRIQQQQQQDSDGEQPSYSRERERAEPCSPFSPLGSSDHQRRASEGPSNANEAFNQKTLTKKSSFPKIKTDLGDMVPLRWEKVVLVQVSVAGFRDMLGKAKDLMEDAKLLYEHTVLSRLSSEYGGQEVLSAARSGLFVIAFPSEFHAAKWCLSLQLSLVYAAWNEKLLRQLPEVREVRVPNPAGNSKKPILIHRGFRVRMVIHTAATNEPIEKSLIDAVKWTKAITSCCHGGQIVLSDSVWDRLKEQLVQLGNPVVEDLGAHLVLEEDIQLMQLLPRDLELRRFNKLRSQQQLSLGMRDAPSALENVTMVFTFIEGARPLVRCHAEALANRIKTLCMIARQLLRKHNGYECQELQGDFMLAFFHPVDAILWCGEFQLKIAHKFQEWGLSTEDKALMFSMSMGIETGRPASVSPHKTSGRADYFGNIVNQTARIAKAAQGGQLLVGGDAWNTFMAHPFSSNLVRAADKLEDNENSTLFKFKSYGYHSFKGISLPIGLIEALPLDLETAMKSPDDAFLNRAPKAKRVDDIQVRALRIPVTPIAETPKDIMRLHHRSGSYHCTIRETEVDVDLSLDDDVAMMVEDSDEEESGSHHVASAPASASASTSTMGLLSSAPAAASASTSAIGMKQQMERSVANNQLAAMNHSGLMAMFAASMSSSGVSVASNTSASDNSKAIEAETIERL